MNKLTILVGVSMITLSGISNAQLFYNNGAMVHLDVGGVIQVNGDLQNDQSGDVENFGDLTVENDVTLSNSSNTLGDGVYNVGGDWINDANFYGDASEVILYGANQLIDGSVVSDFHDLTLTGTGIKTLDINASAYGTLDLTDRELATEGFAFSVTSTAVGAIQRTSGYVSSLLGGYLERYTSASGVYLFPTGSSLNTERYRPVEVIPASSSANRYGVRFVNNDATNDTYDRSQAGDTVCTANPYWYHMIDQLSGSDDIDLTVYYDPIEDGDWDGIANWDDVTDMRWESVGLTMTNVATLTGVTTQNWANFASMPYILIDDRPETPVIGGDQLICGGAIGNYEAWNSPDDIYQWDVTNGTVISDPDTLSQVEILWGSGSAGMVEVYSLENGCRSVDLASLNVAFFASPTALYNYDFMAPSAGNVAFVDSSQGTELSYMWEFGDGETSSLENPYHSYDEPGEYFAMLMVENSDGCIDTIVDTILVEEQLVVPDIFTPNNDGYNDQLVSVNMGICAFNISIYNRWGELVYETTNPSIAWDGKTKSGEEVSEGTYYYVIKGVSCSGSGEVYNFENYVTLLR